MVRRLTSWVAVNERWYRAGQSVDEVGADASAIGDHAWEDDGSPAADAAGEPVIPAPTGEPPFAGEDQPEPGEFSDAPDPVEDDGDIDELEVPEPTGEPPVAGDGATVADSEASSGAPSVAGSSSEEGEGTEGPEPPPRAGRGSSEQAWRDYATAAGVDLSGFETRNEIIEKVEAAGKPV